MGIVKKVFSDSSFTAFRSIVSLARGIVILPLITNLLGEGSYGVWVTIFAVMGLIGSVGGLHLHGSLIRYESQETKNNQTYSDVLFLTFVIGIVLAILVVMVGVIIDVSTLFEDEIADPFALVVLVAVLLLSNKIFQININLPRSKGYVKFYDIGLIIRNFFEILLLAVVFLLGGGILAALAVLAGSLIVMNLAVLVLIAVMFSLPLPNASNYKKYICYGIPMVPKEVSSSLLGNTDKYLLIYFISPTAVGIYAAAQGISRPIVKLTQIFNPTLYPTIAKAWDEGNFDEISTVYENIFRFYSILAIPAAFGLILLSEPLLTVLSTTTIAQEGVYLVPLFISGYFLKGYDNSIRYILTSAERTDVIGGSVMFTVFVNITLNLLFIPEFGMVGAAIATFCSHSLLFAIILYCSLSEIAIKIPWSTIGRSFSAATLMSLILVLVDFEISIYTELIFYPAFGSAIYFFILILIGEFSQSEKSRIKTRFLEYFS